MNVRYVFLLVFLFSVPASAQLSPDGVDLAKKRMEDTEAKVCRGCSTSDTLRRESIRSIKVPNSNLAVGVNKQLQMMYGVCDVGKPINGYFNVVPHSRNVENNGEKYTYPLAEGGTQTIELRTVYGQGRNNNLGPYGYLNSDGYTPRACTPAGGNPYPKYPKAFGMGAGMFQSGQNVVHQTCEGVERSSKPITCGLIPKSKEALTIDCAEFIGAAALSSCIKLSTDQKIDADGFKLGSDELGTSSLKGLADSGNESSCMKGNLSMSAGAPFAKGDIFVDGGDSGIITEVGDDPLGIERVNGTCDAISPDMFNFSFAQSYSANNIGPINATMKDWFCSKLSNTSAIGSGSGNHTSGTSAYNRCIAKARIKDDRTILQKLDIAQNRRNVINEEPFARFTSMARALCEQLKRSGGRSVSSKSVLGNSNRKALLRHNKDKSGCTYQSGQCPSMVGQECAAACEANKARW